MLDTLKLSLMDYEIGPDAVLDVQPSVYCAATGQGPGGFPLWSRSGRPVVGTKAFYNADEFNVTVQPLSASEPLSIGCYVQFSVPKVANGSNYQPADFNATKTALKSIERELAGIGIRTNIKTATLSRLDSCRTVSTAHDYRAYQPVLCGLRGARVAKRDYGTTYLWHNTLQEVCVYDKIEEMKRKKHSVEGLPPNSVRFEHRMLKARKIRDVTGLATVSDMLSGYEQIKAGYVDAMRKQLFKRSPAEVSVLTEGEMVTQLERLKASGKRYYLREYLMAAAVGRMENDFDALVSAVEKVCDSRMTALRLRNQLDQARMDALALRASAGCSQTLGELYRELERKVVGE
jgi:hypothetical protein